MLKYVSSSFRQRFQFFGQNTGIHGLNHLFKTNAAILVRLFWLVIVVASAGCLYLLIIPTLELDGRISFTPDTRYLDWTTTFPAVTVCEQTSAKLAQRKFAELYPDLVESLSYDHRRYLTDLLYGRGVCSRAQCYPCGDLVPCDTPWRAIVENVHKSCEELLTECSYNGAPFPCCETFHPVDSENGPCFSFNTLQNKNFLKGPTISVNGTTGPGVLSFRLISDAQISLHSSEELSTNILSGKFKFVVYTQSDENKVEILFSVVEIENDPMLNDEDVIDRNCRFLHEIPDNQFHNYPVYSYGACKLARETEHSYEHCNCISPVRDLSYQKHYCNYTGLNCLAQFEVQRNKLGLVKDHDDEDCLPSCVESELSIIHHSKKTVPEEASPGTLVNVKMSSLPTLRYKRNLLRTNLDFVVSVGGMAGLFFSASILSVLEIFYLALRKPNK